jgi:hypothetical protein
VTDAVVTLAHAGATLAMTGLIWFVQVVHYPLLRFAAGPSFSEFARHHQRRTGWIVGPLMLGEAATALLLLLRRTDGWTVAGAALLAMIWLSTALLQIPRHRRLAAGFDPATGQGLVKTNWLRTAAWTARAAIALRLAADLGN